MKKKFFLFIFTLAMLFDAPLSHASNTQAELDALPSATKVLLIRHALAPGGNDPSHFKLGDCSTQRNLSAQGVNQAKSIGQQLKKLGFVPDKIWSSQWCRSLDTAKALDLGQVTPLPLLNSYFQNRSEGPQQINNLRQFIINLPSSNGRYIMVTHHVVVGDLSGQWVGSGDGVWLVLTGNPANPWLVKLAPSHSIQLP